jgi:hypothetical protein
LFLFFWFLSKSDEIISIPSVHSSIDYYPALPWAHMQRWHYLTYSFRFIFFPSPPPSPLSRLLTLHCLHLEFIFTGAINHDHVPQPPFCSFSDFLNSLFT